MLGGCSGYPRGGSTEYRSTKSFYDESGKKTHDEVVHVKTEQPDDPAGAATTTIHPDGKVVTTTGKSGGLGSLRETNNLLKPLIITGGMIALIGVISFIAVPKLHPLVPKISIGLIVGGTALATCAFLLAKYAMFVGFALLGIGAVFALYLLRKFVFVERALKETVELVEDEIKPALPTDKKREIFESESAVAKTYQTQPTRKIVKKTRENIRKERADSNIT